MQRTHLRIIRLIAVLLAVAMVISLTMCTPLSRILRATSLQDGESPEDSTAGAETEPGTRIAEKQLLICDREEHVHSDECMDQDGNLICGKEEHVHSDECYETVEVAVPEAPETTELILSEPGESQDESEPVTQEDEALPADTAPEEEPWSASADTALAALSPEEQSNPAARVLAVAGSQVGYAVPSPEETALYGEGPQGWSTAFAIWCLDRAEVFVPSDPDAAVWALNLEDAGRLRQEDPQAGMLLFTDEDGDGSPDRTGIVTAVQNGLLQVVEGDVAQSVQSRTWSLDDPAIFGYGLLTEDPPETAAPEALPALTEDEEPLAAPGQTPQDVEEPVAIQDAPEPAGNETPPAQPSPEPEDAPAQAPSENDDPEPTPAVIIQDEPDSTDTDTDIDTDMEPAPDAQDTPENEDAESAPAVIIQEEPDSTDSTDSDTDTDPDKEPAPDAQDTPENEAAEPNPGVIVQDEPDSTDAEPDAEPESVSEEAPEEPAEVPAPSDQAQPEQESAQAPAETAAPWPAVSVSPAIAGTPWPAVSENPNLHASEPLDQEEQEAAKTLNESKSDGGLLGLIGSLFRSGQDSQTAQTPAWQVSGERYIGSIPENGFLSFRELISALGIAGEGADPVQTFLDQVVSVKTSSEAVFVRRIQADTTLGAFKAQQGIQADHGVLPERQLQALDDTPLSQGDWAILRLEPFHTQDLLRITMKNADVFTVSLSDGQFHRRTLTFPGDDFLVTVSFDDAAGIPENTVLQVTECSEASPEYTEAVEESIRALSDKNGLAAVSQARVFDISLIRDGRELEPLAPVEVQVDYADPVSLEEQSSLQVIHLSEEETQVLDPNLSETEDAGIESFAFTSDSFSTFAFVQAGYIGSLNGQEFAIVRNNGANLAALCTAAHSVSGRLQGTYVSVLGDGALAAVSAPNAQTASGLDIPAFTFTHVRDNVYHIKAEDGSYLAINGTKLTMQEAPWPIEVIPLLEKGIPTGKLRLRDAQGKATYLNLKGGNPANGFQGSTSTDGNSTFTLYAAESLKTYDATYARKLSAAEITAGQELVIYRRMLNPDTGKYETYALDGNGGLIYAYDRGDAITFRSGRSTLWYVIEHTDETGAPNGYYDFFCPGTGMYLAPRHDGTVGASRVGVLLGGKADGAYNTTIESWDSTAWAYYGYQLDVDAGVLIPGTGPASQEFSFALPEIQDDSRLHTVETVDSAAAGISIQMYDFSSRKVMNLFSNDTFYPDGAFKQGLLRNRLGEDGLPVSATGVPFSRIYNSSNFTGNANHLFLSSVYHATGYYEYSSFRNYAHYDRDTGNFTVYDEQGTPSNGTGGSVSSFLRGNYLPYNQIDPQRKAVNTVLYENGTDMMTLENPAFDSTLYLTDTPDYFFGTIVEASFLQSKDGIDDYGNPIVYEFEGDDDLWVFLDGVLVLDIGGIHSAVGGSIDFSTGTVLAGSTRTTIRDCFQAAGVFPDGTAWSGSLVENYFSGDTFNDYSGHQMKMFYQERGAGASTLTVRFNLPVVESGTFAVEKQLGATNQQNYSNVQFAYQAFVETEDGTTEILYPGVNLSDQGEAGLVRTVYEDSGSPVNFYDGAEIGGRTYDHVFYLRPGEAAVFSGIPEDVKYYVQEIDVSGAFYETVMINDADMGGEGGISEDAAITARSSSKTIQERQRVLFVNKCSPRNMRDLRITKEVENPIDDGASFEFRVSLEGKSGELTYYSGGEYYLVRQVDGQDHYYQFVEGVLTDQGTAPVVCSYSGAYGTIAGIPDGYTVVIKGLLAGTDFLVEEIRNPAGYIQVEKAVTPDTCDPADISGADGQIRLGKDAEMTVRNRRCSVITAQKVWENSEAVTAHGSIQMGLFRQDGGALVLAEQGDVLKSEPVQTVFWPETTAFWNLELPVGQTLEDYTVLEVIAQTGPDGAQTVTPLGSEEILSVLGETLQEGRQTAGSYAVSYQPGQEQLLTEDPWVRIRTDTVTNRRIAGQQLSFRKVDVADPEKVLSGAVFDIIGVENGTLTSPLFAGLCSGEDGILRLDGESIFQLPLGTWALVETEAPAGYNRNAEPILVTVTARDVSYSEGTTMSDSGQGVILEGDLYILTLTNNSGFALPATGGSGTLPFAVSGLLLLLTALLLLFAGAGGKRRRSPDSIS